MSLARLARKATLTEDNRIVHGMWIGKRLSKLELLTIHSFLRHGHEFHLWLYDDLETRLPRQVILEDAEAILPRGRIFVKREHDRESGVGRNSIALFADLFRYKLLYEKGGWWVDMDVTCLRSFNFSSNYVFRAHRVGVVNNIMKCPPQSRLMELTYEQVEREVGQDSPWHLTNRILTHNVAQLNLRGYVYSDVWNQDDWLGAVKSFVESDSEIPREWVAIHWTNEMWRTLKDDHGYYKGRRFVASVPDKETLDAGTTLGRLYRDYGLDGDTPSGQARPITAAPLVDTVPVPALAPIKRQPAAPDFPDTLHLNVLVPSLALGGAERIVVETLQGLAQRQPTAKLFVLNDKQPEYQLGNIARASVYRLDGLDMTTKLRTVALEVLASPMAAVFTHLIQARFLQALWDWGVSTIPVIHNSQPAWQDAPASFNHEHVPFVVAVSESVAQQLRRGGCVRPIITLRHELQRWFSFDALRAARREIRARHGIPDETLLIGMVGEFKAQKAYTRAVRVLAEIRRHHAAKLMILGGWDHAWGHGRFAYTAACRQALELDVMADLLTPGVVKDVEPYYAAFDVFLNTSVFEGLSVAALEAVHSGCPIVSADAGGNPEMLPADAVVVKDSSDIAAYVAGIEKVLARGRCPVPVRRSDADLIPRLWCLIGQYGRAEEYERCQERTKTLFLTDNLNLGGAGRSLVNLLCRLPRAICPWVAILNECNHQAYLDQLEKSNIPVFSLRSAGTYLDSVERILQMTCRLGARTLVFWNADARVKLLLAKILPRGAVRLIDVSPAKWLYEDLDRAAELQRRIGLDRAAYFDRLDHFVAKYSGGGPSDLALHAGKFAVIPNGVPDLASEPVRLPAPELPRGSDPEFVIGTCCRILPSNRLEFLVDVMAELNVRLPGCLLVVVGATLPRHVAYFKSIQERMRARGVANIHFAGQQADVVPFLRLFRVFVIFANDHGCPNASLEAMSIGLPVLANPAGGTVEQVEHGSNGFLVSDQDPRETAHRIRTLLTNPKMHQRFGEASRKIARERFSMETMVERYAALLGAEDGVLPQRGTACTQPMAMKHERGERPRCEN